MSTSEKSRVLCPTHDERDQSARLAGDLDPAGGLHVPHAEPGRRAEVGRRRPGARRSRTARGRPTGRRRTPRRASARRSLKTPIDVSAGGSSQPWPDSGTSDRLISGCASSAGRPCCGAAARPRGPAPRPRRARRCCGTRRRSRCPRRPRAVAMTVRLRPRITPLVVSVFAAQRRLASLVSWAITMQPSVRGAAGRARRRPGSTRPCWSGSSARLRLGVEDPHAAEQGRRGSRG